MIKPDEFVGQQIGPYQIQQYIASGGMAHVYLACNVDLQRDDVLKILNPIFAQDKSLVKRFGREAQAMARLNHRNIVQVYYTGLTDLGQPYIAMQYVSGGSLADKLAQLKEEGKTLSTIEVLSLVQQIADGLAAAHRAGIVHRDLKPSNILLQPDGTPLLTDLGIAIVADNPRLTRTDMVVGTPYYMSPEQIRADKVDERSDIYSLGLILYELLAGMHPFDADSQWAIINKQLHEKPAPLQEMRAGLSLKTQRLVHTCLEKDPDSRFQTAEQLKEALDEALQAERFAPQPSSGAIWGGRRWLYALVPLLLLAAGFGIWQFWLPPTATPTTTPTPPVIEVAMAGSETTTPSRAAATDTLEPTPTLAARSVVDAEPTSTPTRRPTATAAPPTATVSPTPSTSPTATNTSAAMTPEAVAAELVVTINANLRRGPGNNYSVEAVLSEDTRVRVIARTSNQQWYNVALLDEPITGWLWQGAVEPVGGVNLGSVEVAQTIPAPPPTNTPTRVPPTLTPTSPPAPPPGNGGGDGGENPPPPPGPEP
ncbi:MAG TPA: protein kinase, partial [Anaerolineae bacterium]